jgi:hypothetical protein
MNSWRGMYNLGEPIHQGTTKNLPPQRDSRSRFSAKCKTARSNAPPPYPPTSTPILSHAFPQ